MVATQLGMSWRPAGVGHSKRDLRSPGKGSDRAPRRRATGPPDDGMIYDVEDLRFGYGAEPVLRDVSLKISAGEFVAVVGPNGAGKSTLLKLMAGIVSRFEGGPRF